MKPILYFDNISPPVRSVLLLIEALNIDVDYQFVDLFAQEHLAEDYVKLNPLHTVPTLKHDDLILTDSHAILFYLCDVYGDGTIFELKNPVLRGKVLNRLMFNSSVLFQRDKDVMMEIFQKRVTKVDEHAEKIYEAYRYMETYLENTKFIADENISIADFSVLATLSTLELLFPITRSFPCLSQWFQNMKELPYYAKASDPGTQKLKEKLKAIGNFDLK